MSERYGEYEQVNGAVANRLMDELKAAKNLMKLAVGELTRMADEPKYWSTVGGEWDGTEHEAKEEYDRLMSLAASLK